MFSILQLNSLVQFFTAQLPEEVQKAELAQKLVHKIGCRLDVQFLNTKSEKNLRVGMIEAGLSVLQRFCTDGAGMITDKENQELAQNFRLLRTLQVLYLWYYAFNLVL